MNASLQHISFLAPWTTTASSQPKHPKTTVPYHFALPKYISHPFPTLGKHKKCINITVPIVGNPKIFIFQASQLWDCYKYSFLPRPNVGTTPNIHFSPHPTHGTTKIIHFSAVPTVGTPKKLFFSHCIRAITANKPILTVSPT